VLPSASTVNIEWIKKLENEGARDVVILSHPYDDGIYREDAHWLLNRLHLRPALGDKRFALARDHARRCKSSGRFFINLHRETQNPKVRACIAPCEGTQ
jgi:hypothetical protein